MKIRKPLAAVTVLVVLAGGCRQPASSAAPVPTAPVPTASDPTVAITSSESASAEGSNCPAQHTVKEPYPASTDAGIVFNNPSFYALFRNSDWAFSTEVVAQWRDQLLSTGPIGALDKTVKAKGFTYGGGEFGAQVVSAAPGGVTLTNIRPVNIVEECIPVGLALLFGNEGGGVTDLTFDLDAAKPLAHPEDAGPDSEPYFDNHKDTVDTKEGRWLTLDFHVGAHAYSFDLLFEYTSGGTSGHQVVDNGGEPFRVTPSLCFSPDDRARMTAADAQRLSGLQYQNIRERTKPTEVSAVSPEQFTQRCLTR